MSLDHQLEPGSSATSLSNPQDILLGTLAHGTMGAAENATAMVVVERIVLSPLALTSKFLD